MLNGKSERCPKKSFSVYFVLASSVAERVCLISPELKPLPSAATFTPFGTPAGNSPPTPVDGLNVAVPLPGAMVQPGMLLKSKQLGPGRTAQDIGFKAKIIDRQERGRAGIGKPARQYARQ